MGRECTPLVLSFSALMVSVGYHALTSTIPLLAKQHLTQPTWFSTCDRPTSVDVAVSDDSVTACTSGSHSRPTVHTSGHIMESMTPEQEVQDPSQDTAATLLEGVSPLPLPLFVYHIVEFSSDQQYHGFPVATFRIQKPVF